MALLIAAIAAAGTNDVTVVRALGEFEKTGEFTFPATPQPKLLDLLLRVGKRRPWAQYRRARIRRRKPGSEEYEETPCDLREFFTTGHTNSVPDIVLQHGDILLVPMRIL